MSNNNHLFILTTTLRHVYGGRTNSLLHRARLLTENKSPVNKITLLTCNYNPNYNDVYEDYRARENVNKQINFLNIYDWFKRAYYYESSNYIDRLKNVFEKDIRNNYQDYLTKHFDSDLYEIEVNKSYKAYYNKKGLPQYYLFYSRKDKRYLYIDVYLEDFQYAGKRLFINAKGNIHQIRYFRDKLKRNIIRDVFLNEDMNAYFAREYYYRKKKFYTHQYILFKGDGTTEVFKKESEFFTYWFNQILENGDKIVSDARALDDALLNVDKQIKRIFQIHGPHLDKPSDPDTKIKKNFLPLLENVENEEDIIITLTEGQKKDMIDRYPRLDNKIKVIPHCIETDKIKVHYNKVEPKTINIISRLVPLKRIDHVLKAFNKFLQTKPDYVLNIYGHGESESDLKKLTKELNIEKNVKFKGYTTSPFDVFQASEFTLLTSEYEGLGLTVLEGIANGCPVISYDIKWGPNEIIDDHNGLLVTDGNIDELTEAIIYLSEHPFKRKDVAKVNKKFSKKNFLKEWNQLLKN